MVTKAFFVVVLLGCVCALVRCTAAQQQTATRLGQSVCQVIEKYDPDAGIFIVRMHVMPEDAGLP